MSEENLIFIVSQPRSGSTYLQNLLSNTKEVSTASEHWTLLNFVSLIKPDIVSAPFDMELAHDAFKEHLSKNQDIPFSENLKLCILSLYEYQKGDSKLVLDKTPRYYEILDEIVALFPKSKLIILKRDPVNILCSIIKTWGIDSLEKLTYYRRDLFFAIPAMDGFIKNQANNPNVREVHYEKLLENTSGELQGLCEWLDIAFSEAMLDTTQNTKIQGKYGDPFQSPLHQKEYNKEKAQSFEMNSELKTFVGAYEKYAKERQDKQAMDNRTDEDPLIDHFLKLKGIANVKTDQRAAFLDLQRRNLQLQSEINTIKTSTSFYVGKTLLKPFVFLKTKFK